MKEHPSTTSTIRQAYGALKALYLIPVRFYRKFISPLKPQGSCRYQPTCSAYAMEAVEEWGIVIGTILALWRILRCNPFGKGGYDPVPKRKKRTPHN